MPDLVYPVTYPVVDGDVTVAGDVFDLIYADPNFLTGLNIINGGLDVDNLATAFRVGPEHTQRGSFVDVEGASGTANLDYKNTWFTDFEMVEGTWVFDSKDPQYSIPGGCTTFHLKWPAQVLFVWSVTWTAYTSDADAKSNILLAIDGTYAPGQLRAQSRIRLAADPHDPKGYQKARTWTGHTLVEMTQGWHDVSLMVLADRLVAQTRIHGVSIDVLSICYGAAT